MTPPNPPNTETAHDTPGVSVEVIQDQDPSTASFTFSRLRLSSRVHDLRMKVLLLVVLSALVPALLVGTASYLTARRILLDKLNAELAGRGDASANVVLNWFEDRSRDTAVFANSFIVSENLERWETARKSRDSARSSEAQRRLEHYLAQVQERYPLYRSLSVVDAQANPVARNSPAEDGGQPRILPQLLSSDAPTALEHAGGQTLLHVRHRVRGQDSRTLGTLVTVSGMKELWRALRSQAPTEFGQLRVIDAHGELLFDTRSDSPNGAWNEDSEGVRLCLSGTDGISRYRGGRGQEVLGAYRFLGSHQLGLMVELDSEEALAAVHRLRNFTLLISLLAAGLVTGAGYGLVVGVSRPIEALIAGAKAVSEGDLSQEIPIFSRDQVGYLTKVFNRMTRTLKETHQKLERMSSTDELTGLYNRRHLAKVFNGELNRAERSAYPLSVLMIDIDHFKKFNDRHGHLQGDSLLRDAGAFLLRQLRPSDIAARYGGEEFIVLLPATPKDEAYEIAERLRKGFADVPLTADKKSQLTLSIGIASHPEHAQTEEQLVRAADAALYKAKRQGRNKVVVSKGR